ncbi:MAG: hypothetical protein AAF797_05400 [Planctomycetota bacterium]
MDQAVPQRAGLGLPGAVVVLGYALVLLGVGSASAWALAWLSEDRRLGMLDSVWHGVSAVSGVGLWLRDGGAMPTASRWVLLLTGQVGAWVSMMVGAWVVIAAERRRAIIRQEVLDTPGCDIRGIVWGSLIVLVGLQALGFLWLMLMGWSWDHAAELAVGSVTQLGLVGADWAPGGQEGAGVGRLVTVAGLGWLGGIGWIVARDMKRRKWSTAGSVVVWGSLLALVIGAGAIWLTAALDYWFPKLQGTTAGTVLKENLSAGQAANYWGESVVASVSGRGLGGWWLETGVLAKPAVQWVVLGLMVLGSAPAGPAAGFGLTAWVLWRLEAGRAALAVLGTGLVMLVVGGFAVAIVTPPTVGVEAVLRLVLGALSGVGQGRLEMLQVDASVPRWVLVGLMVAGRLGWVIAAVVGLGVLGRGRMKVEPPSPAV